MASPTTEDDGMIAINECRRVINEWRGADWEESLNLLSNEFLLLAGRGKCALI